MNKPKIRKLVVGLASGALLLLATAHADAQCTELVSGLREPLGTALTNQGNLLVSESGTGAPSSGRISIVAPSGNRRTLLDGLPSGINDVGSPSGPAGLFMKRSHPLRRNGDRRRWPRGPLSGIGSTKPQWAVLADL